MEPFLKWAGGKRWLTTRLDKDLVPNNYNRYCEPFLGSAAVFFHLKPANGGFLSDKNSDLINVYKMIKKDWELVVNKLFTYQQRHSEAFYYSVRNKVFTDPIENAARFIYLNRTCWNGLYRVNLQGEFNVPLGTKSKVILEEDDFQTLSLFLSEFRLYSGDFEKVINMCEEGDFAFIDPPYTVRHNMNGFIKYNEKLFSWGDQIRLKEAVVRAIKRGVKVLVTNADHSSIRQLYNGVGQIVSLNRASVIAGKSSARGTYSEIAIKTWD